MQTSRFWVSHLIFSFQITLQYSSLSRQEKNSFTLWYKQTQSMGGFGWSKTTLRSKRDTLLFLQRGFSVNKSLAAQSRAFSDSLQSSKLSQNSLSITRSNSPLEGLVMVSCYYKSETSISQLQNLKRHLLLWYVTVSKRLQTVSASVLREIPHQSTFPAGCLVFALFHLSQNRV